MLGTRNGHDVRPFREQPGKRELTRRAALLARQLLHPAHEIEILLEILALEARMILAPVAFLDVLRPFDLAGQESAAQRAVRDETDLEFANGRQDFVLDIATPEGVLRLESGDRTDGVRAPHGLRRRMRQPEVADLALLGEIGHGADGFFDRHGAVDTMLVVEIDVLDPEALQRRVAGVFHVFRPAVDAHPLPFGSAHVADFSSQSYLVAFT